ncbi:hypothetical protein [Burkholderia paludis]|uniref:hypothetical protein n=1 Tax=Burkholderia paludis TaxID=1506587 RepID=UPI000B2B75BD|nr:hypothetical protein [Burkholderia paludis]
MIYSLMHEFVFSEDSLGKPGDFGFHIDQSMIDETRITLARAMGRMKFYDYGDAGSLG